MMRRLLYALTGRLPLRIISDDGRPYLERYYVCTVLGVRVYVHRFVGSDPDRGLHDHPWPWARSIILSGCYIEERRDGYREVRWWNSLQGDTFHRVILWEGQEVWTLFMHRAENAKPWGFLRPVPGEWAQLWHPWNYPKDGSASSGRWWETVPRGRDEARRVPLR